MKISPKRLGRHAALGVGLLVSIPIAVQATPPPRPSDLAGLDSLAAATLLQALDYLDIEQHELGFDKLYAEDDTFRLPVVEQILNDPLRLPGWQSETVTRLRETITDPTAVMAELARLSDAEDGQTLSPVAWPAITGPGETRGRVYAEAVDLQERFDRFIQGAAEAAEELERAFEGLSPEARDQLLMSAPAVWGDWSVPAELARKGALHRELGAVTDTTAELTEDVLLDWAVAVDRRALTRAARGFLHQLALLAADADQIQLPPAIQGLDGVDGPITLAAETPWGLFVVGGPSDNTYGPEVLARIAFLLEPGGDDVYRGRAASAVGGLLRPLCALVDWGGDDLYDGGDRDYGIGGAVLGLAALLDLGGDDVYRGRDGCCGAGYFGAGVLYDASGRDSFTGRNLSQGAGAFGLGMLVSECTTPPPPGPEIEPDRAFEAGLVRVPGTGARPIRADENDSYQCARQSQGFASTFGVGLLYDRTGNDTYRAGGTYLHAPLLPNDFQALSQGFAIGFRPRAAGGVGLLLDEEGNDFYAAEVYAQGASYWYSLGLLCDGGGNDRYLATQYGQGAGIHLSVGALWDLGGDDHYCSKFGVTQGNAHDLSVGLLLDESGRDYYVVNDGQGFSITNSVAIFIDGQGDDFYATYSGGQGSLTWARGFCGAGIFLDLEGHDTYPASSPGRDGAVWSQRTYGLGIDLDRDVTLPDEVLPEIVLTAEDSAAAVADLFETASLWEVGSAREKVRRARQALIAKGIEALDYVVCEKLGSRSGLELRAIEELARAYPDSFTARVLPLLESGRERVQRNVIGLLGELERDDARRPLEAMLQSDRQETHWTRVIAALGRIGDAQSAPLVRPFLEDEQQRRRLAAVGALRALRDTTAVDGLVRLLGDEYFTVRSAAHQALLAFGACSVAPLIDRWRAHEGDQREGRARDRRAGADRRGDGVADQRRLALHTLGALAAGLRDSTDAASVTARAAARRALMGVLEAPLETSEPACRAAAVEGLLALGDEPTRAFVRLHMEDEFHPLVRRTYERATAELEARR